MPKITKPTQTQTLHLLRNDFGVSSPSFGGILALHPLRNDFGAKLCIPLGTTLELRHLLLKWYLVMHPHRNDFGASSHFLGGILALHSRRNDFGASLYFYTQWCNLRSLHFTYGGNLPLYWTGLQKRNGNYNLWPH
jgi:hypothetical protein